MINFYKSQGEPHYHEHITAQEQTVTEDGTNTYWRLAVPLPFVFATRWFTKRFMCHCGRHYRNLEGYELHYRKAAFEEKERL